MNQIFPLENIAEKCLAKSQKVYCVFVGHTREDKIPTDKLDPGNTIMRTLKNDENIVELEKIEQVAMRYLDGNI